MPKCILGLHAVEVHQNQLPDSRSDQLCCDVSADRATANEQDSLGVEGFRCATSREEGTWIQPLYDHRNRFNSNIRVKERVLLASQPLEPHSEERMTAISTR